ncbi:unnamed protein product [Zymoseptoria tritici ST99CH_3D7]|uniref:Uncharacterized protein n=2 Tax=Zymoseptoria tritici TaxID=1047171 RepID=A0A1X7S7L3_ZYMT9|nr:unnamed protein product [Zymoseptoria tritici ST99CH_3D7]SMR60863.1 unnamed protein product [Zymoseptoria tritici ST99CH_1E4]
MIPHANAIRKVLSQIDHHYKHDTTTVARLRCMQSICGIRKLLKVPRTRSRFHDFNSLYKAMERAVKQPENQDARVWAETLPGGWPMEKLFLVGSRIFAAEFLAGVGYSSGNPPVPDAASGDDDPDASPLPDLADSGDAVIAGDASGVVFGEKRKHSDSDEATSPPDSEPVAQNTDQVGRHNDEASSMRSRMLAISTSIEEITRSIFPSDQHPRLAAPTLAPDTALKALYEDVLGSDLRDESWKVIAIELQAAGAFDAEKFLQALIWSFISESIFPTGGFWTKHVENIALSLRKLGSLNEQEQKQRCRDILRNELQDVVFRNTEIMPEAQRLAHGLASTLEPHLDIIGGGKTSIRSDRREFELGLRCACFKALLLKGYAETTLLHREYSWFGFDRPGRAIEMSEMEDDGYPPGGKIAFTIMPEFSWTEGDGPNVVVKARVETIKPASEED